MDYRSMYLNMECAVYMQGVDTVLDIEEDFKNTLLKCNEITLEDCEKYSKIKQMIGKLLWLISPLM